jgi:hypothetical protein
MTRIDLEAADESVQPFEGKAQSRGKREGEIPNRIGALKVASSVHCSSRLSNQNNRVSSIDPDVFVCKVDPITGFSSLAVSQTCWCSAPSVARAGYYFKIVKIIDEESHFVQNS